MFATRVIHQGEFICEYNGDLVTAKEGKQRDEEYRQVRASEWLISINGELFSDMIVTGYHRSYL